jgi:hypothetical protein
VSITLKLKICCHVSILVFEQKLCTVHPLNVCTVHPLTNPSGQKDVLDEIVRQCEALLVNASQGPPGQNVAGSGQEVPVHLVRGEVGGNLIVFW